MPIEAESELKSDLEAALFNAQHMVMALNASLGRLAEYNKLDVLDFITIHDHFAAVAYYIESIKFHIQDQLNKYGESKSQKD